MAITKVRKSVSGLSSADIPYTDSQSNVTNVSARLLELEGSTGSSGVGYLPAGTGAATNLTIQDKLRKVVSVTDFGAVGDGGTDDTAALQNALTDGQRIIDEGTYIGETASSALITTTGSSLFNGNGASSVLNIEEQNATGVSTAIVTGADNFVLRDTNVNFSKAAVGVSAANLIDTRNNNIQLDNVIANGQTTLVSGAADRTVRMVRANETNSTENVTVFNSQGNNLSYGFIKDNPTATTQKSVKYLFNRFKNAWRTVLAFNSPNGAIQDVAAIGNTFDTNAGAVNGDPGAATLNNAIGLVGVIGGRVIGNHVTGKFGAVAHVEENSDCNVVLGNTAYMANPLAADGAIEILSNNNSGTTVTPLHLNISHNVLRSTDEVGHGIYFQTGASADSAQWSAVLGNIVQGFDTAFRFITGNLRSTLVAHNVFRGTTNGAQLNRASLLFKDNVIENCTAPIVAVRGGLVGGVFYVNESSATGGLTAFGSSTTGPLSLTEWTWETSLFNTVNGTQYLDIGPMPTRIYGFFTISINQAATVHRLAVIETSYDGVTVTNTSKLSFGSGTITIAGPSNHGGKFAIQFSDAAASGSTNARLQVRFHNGAFVI